jgi:hypothetical protein
MLISQIKEKNGLSGEELAKSVMSKIEESEQLPQQRSVGESMSEMFKGSSASAVNRAADAGAQRNNAGDEEKLLVLQS